MVIVQGAPPSSLPEQTFQQLVASGQLHQEAAVSLDGGRSWIAAWQAAQRLALRGSDETALMVPTHVEAWSLVAGYAAIFSTLFFGGPIVFATSLIAWDTGPKIHVRAIAVLVGLALGPLPIAGVAWLALRGLRKDTTLRGRGRAIFALVVAAFLGLGSLAGIVGILVRH